MNGDDNFAIDTSSNAYINGNYKTGSDLSLLGNEDVQLLQMRYELIKNALAAQKKDQSALEKFGSLLKNDFVAFANSASSIIKPAEAIFQLQEIAKKLDLISAFPVFASKTLVAVGGGFSSGKSSFISSFFEDASLQLPIGIEPVTAIPCYVFSGNDNAIRGHTYKGGVIDISPDFYGQLSHEFVKSFGFNLKEIIPYFAIETSLRNLDHVSFVDLPGYNPAGSENYTEQDNETALTQIQQADAIIWVIGLDSNGTIPLSDIEFLAAATGLDKPLYIVGNKADLKPGNDIGLILDNFRDTLDSEGISYAGIAAYSSSEAKQYRFRGQALNKFLSALDNENDAKASLIKEIDSMFIRYSNAIKKSFERNQEFTNSLHSFDLDLSELGLFDVVDEEDSGRGRKRRKRSHIDLVEDSRRFLKELKSKFNTASPDDLLAEAKRIKAEMKSAIKEI